MRVRFGGLGGQGIVLAGSVLGEAATLAGLHASGSNSYGAAARGTACRSDVVISDAVIDYPHLAVSDVLLVMSQAAYLKYLPNVAERGAVFYDDFAVHPASEVHVPHHAVAATSTALREFGSRLGGNVILLGVLVGATNVVPLEAVREGLRRNVRERFLADNLRALDLGIDMGRRLIGREP
jgi:2-oxoglutarate ferredoxin oxidoreductase subunit gamma